MKFEEYLQEEYLTRFGSEYVKSAGYEVFVNPTKSELRSIKEVRYIIDFKNKKLYVWDSNSAIHMRVAIELYKMKLFPYDDIYDKKTRNSITFGIGHVTGDKIEYDECHELESYIGLRIPIIERNWFGLDDSWLNLYFTSPYIKTIMDDLRNKAGEYMGIVFKAGRKTIKI